MDDSRKEISLADVEMVCDQICEMKLPFASLGADAQNSIRFVVYAKKTGMQEQRFPPGGQYMEIIPPDKDFEDRMWYV